MLELSAVLLTVAVLLYTLSVREGDLPPPEPVSPVKHLEERKAAIYENLRDLQFEHRLGKLSDQDYQQTKQDLQRELAVVLAAIDNATGQATTVSPAGGDGRQVSPAQAPAPGSHCPHCGARFPTALKFCGECGKPIAGANS